MSNNFKKLTILSLSLIIPLYMTEVICSANLLTPPTRLVLPAGAHNGSNHASEEGLRVIRVGEEGVRQIVADNISPREGEFGADFMARSRESVGKMAKCMEAIREAIGSTIVQMSREQMRRLRDGNGIFIVAFGGKTQNENTHPSLLPDLSELTFLARLGQIGRFFDQRVTVVLDGQHYASLFQERVEPILRYNQGLRRWNEQFSLGLSFWDPGETEADILAGYISSFKQNPALSREVSGIPDESLVAASVVRNAPFQWQGDPGQLAFDYLAYKAAINKLITDSLESQGVVKISMGVFSKPETPRFNLLKNYFSKELFPEAYESRIPPWSGVAALRYARDRVEVTNVSQASLMQRVGRERLVEVQDPLGHPLAWFDLETPGGENLSKRLMEVENV